MKQFLLPVLLLTIWADTFASQDSVVVPINRQRFHDRIDNEQLLTDKADGKKDGLIRVSGNEEINLQVTDAFTRKINEFQNFVETNSKISSNNEKIRQLNFIEELVRNFRSAWKQKTINPALAPLLVEDFYKMWIANMDSGSILPFINDMPYEVGMLLTNIFPGNIGYSDSRKSLFLKYCRMHPDKILSIIRPYVDEPFADSLVLVGVKYDVEPVKVFAVVNVGHFRLVDVEGVDCYASGYVVPVPHNVLLGGAHREGTTLHKHQPGTGTLLFFFGNLEAPHL